MTTGAGRAGEGAAVAKAAAMPVNTAREELRARLAVWSNGLLNVLGLLMLAIVIARVAAHPSPAWTARLNRLGVEIWVIFVLDFLVQLALAPAKLPFLRRHWLLALSVVMPAFRIVHVVRALVALRAFGLAPVLAGMNSATRAVERVTRKHKLGRAMALTAGVTVLGAVGLIGFEGQGVDHFGTALWWSAAFVTTVGSNFEPRTAEGRVLALLLVIWGLGVVGYVTAAIATSLIGDTATDASATPDGDDVDELGQLRQEVAELKTMLTHLLAQQQTNGHEQRSSTDDSPGAR